MPILLHIEDIDAGYDRTPILSGFSMDLPAGSLVAVLGPNGGGKSTLLKVLCGLLPLTQGQLRNALGCEPFRTAYLPQQTELDRSFPLSVRDVVMLGLYPELGFFQEIPRTLDARIQDALNAVGLSGCGDKSLQALSGGQLQRVLFARLILQDAQLLLLDEPFAAIDRYTIEDLIHLLEHWRASGKTIVVVTHDLDLVLAHFPLALLLAREPLAFGATKDVVTLENLKKAKEHARRWESVCASSSHVAPMRGSL